MAKNAATIAEKWARNLGAAGQSYKEGVMAVTEAPTAKAARALDRALQNYTEAIQSGRMADKLNGVSLQQWQQQTANVGAPRLTQGATAAKPKMQGFMDRWLPVAEQISQTVAALPKGGEANAIARIMASYRMAKQFARKPA